MKCQGRMNVESYQSATVYTIEGDGIAVCTDGHLDRDCLYTLDLKNQHICKFDGIHCKKNHQIIAMCHQHFEIQSSQQLWIYSLWCTVPNTIVQIWNSPYATDTFNRTVWSHFNEGNDFFIISNVFFATMSMRQQNRAAKRDENRLLIYLPQHNSYGGTFKMKLQAKTVNAHHTLNLSSALRGMPQSYSDK